MAIVYRPPKQVKTLKYLKQYNYALIVSDPDGVIGPPLASSISAAYFPFELLVDYSHVASPDRRETLLFVCLMIKSNVEPSRVIRLRKRFPSRPILIVDCGGSTDQSLLYKQYNIDYETWEGNVVELAKHLKTKVESLPKVKASASKAIDPTKLYSLAEVADQIDTIASAIADLRLNSTSQAVDDLLSISSGLRRRPNVDVVSSDHRQPRYAIKEALQAIATLYDALENSKLAGIIVSGAVSALVGGAGWSSTMCFTVALASWNGKEAFMAAVNRLPTTKLPKSLPKD